jgi:hypothetical protein
VTFIAREVYGGGPGRADVRGITGRRSRVGCLRSVREESGSPAAAIILLVGIAFGIVAFHATASVPSVQFGRPFCSTVEEGGFDPWTGAAHGRLNRCALPADTDAPQIWSDSARIPRRGHSGFRGPFR